MLSVVTSQDLNKVQLSISGELTDEMRWEHRAHERVMESVNNGSLREGFQNLHIVRHPNVLIDQMVADGALPTDCKIGKTKFMGLSKFQRTAIATPVTYLMQYEGRIHNWIEDHTSHNPIDVFNVLLACAVIGASQGHCNTASAALSALYRTVRELPSGKARTKLLRDKERTLKLISGD